MTSIKKMSAGRDLYSAVLDIIQRYDYLEQISQMDFHIDTGQFIE
jgi:hypothetical protein